MAINVLIKKTGPYVLSGDLSQLEIADADGKKVDISGKQAIALCRCGASTNKPFCDGTHSKIGRLAAEPAVKPEGWNSAVSIEFSRYGEPKRPPVPFQALTRRI